MNFWFIRPTKQFQSQKMYFCEHKISFCNCLKQKTNPLNILNLYEHDYRPNQN